MILVYLLATGAKLADNLVTLPASFDATKQGWREQPIGYPDRIAWQASLPGFVDVEQPPTLEKMLATIDYEREIRMMTDLTDGGAKKYEYAEKAREVRDYRSLGGAVVASLLIPLNISGTRDRFGWSMAEAEDTGDTLETVIARYEKKIVEAAFPRKVAARAQKLKRQLRAAAPTARAAIFNARTWPS